MGATESALYAERACVAETASMGPSLGSDGKRRTQERYSTRLQRFNGAVAWERRKVGDFERARSGAEVLQWGRRLGATESFPGVFAEVSDASGFNGAVAWERRKESGTRTRSSRRTRRFNGAVAWERRKAVAIDFQAVVMPQLQWGRRLGATERAYFSAAATCLASLQWGRRLGATERTSTSGALTRADGASMGPSLGSDGKLHAHHPSRPREGRFNGAVAWERRKDVSL